MITVIGHGIPDFWEIKEDYDSAMFNIVRTIDRTYHTQRNLVIMSEWYRLLPAEKNLSALQPQNYDMVFVVSLFDWEDQLLLDEVTQWHQQTPVSIGNTNNGHYICFWALIVNKYYHYSLDQVMPLYFNHAFMCYNRKVHEHRARLIQGIIDRGLESAGVITLGAAEPGVLERYPELAERIPMLLPEDQQVSIDRLTGNTADCNMINDIGSIGNINVWKSHFLNVVTETTVHTDVFLSEKIFKPIVAMRPFVVLGDDRVIEHLHQLGFKTFESWFSEEYSRVSYNADPDTKVKLLCDIIEMLTQKTDTELIQMYKEMYSTLEHNRLHFYRFAAEQKHHLYNGILDAKKTK